MIITLSRKELTDIINDNLKEKFNPPIDFSKAKITFRNDRDNIDIENVYEITHLDVII